MTSKTANLALGGAVALFALALAYFLASKPAGPSLEEPGTAAPPMASSPPSASAPTVVSAAASDCDEFALYGRQLTAVSGDQARAHAATIAELTQWSTECRWRAFEKRCGSSCWNFESDRLISAAGVDEALKLRRERLLRNERAEAEELTAMARVRALVKYATGIRATPRGLTPACATRMGKDFATVDALKKELSDGAKRLPPGHGLELASTVALAKACLDCGPTREACDDMIEGLKSGDENAAAWAKQNQAEREALGKDAPENSTSGK